MFDWFTNSNEWRRRLPTYLGWALLLPVLVFSGWLLWAFSGSILFRDRLFEKEYEGSLSTELGLLVALTSEASQSAELGQDRATAESLRETLRRIREELIRVEPPASSAGLQPSSITLATSEDEAALRALLVSPELSRLSLSQLGLAVGTRTTLPGYPFLEALGADTPTLASVFFPASGVEVEAGTARLSLRGRRELVLSRLAELKLRPLFEELPEAKIMQAYFIGCSDFIRLVFPKPTAAPAFSPLRSFVDRTYFNETREATDGLRESALYLDVTGSGLVKTHTAFVQNTGLGLCGLLALDVEVQPLGEFWRKLTLGWQGGGLRDFSSAILDLPDRTIEPGSSFSGSLRNAIEAEVATWPAGELQGGIRRMVVDQTKVFTVPIGGDRIGLLAFNEAAIRRKYYGLLVLGTFLIVSFVLTSLASARGHRAAAEAEQLQREILEKLHGGFAIVDRQGNIKGATERFRVMAGSSAGVPPVEGFLSKESATEYQKLASGESFSFAGTIRRPGRADEPVIVASAPVSLPGENGARMLILIPSRDLEEKIAKKFLNVFSHALKSPVHSILLIADLFRRRNALPRFEDYYSQLYRKVQEFRTLTDNVLRFSALDVKAIQPEVAPMNVARALRQVLSASHARAKVRGLILRESIPENLHAESDAQLLAVLFNYLIDNALKYTHSGHIAVHATNLLTKIQIAVEDSGPGVPMSERKTIFDLFVQGTNAKHGQHEGLGLGLHISRQYLEALGGTLRYEPILKDPQKPDEDTNLAGSRFVVELPKEKKEASHV